MSASWEGGINRSNAWSQAPIESLLSIVNMPSQYLTYVVIVVKCWKHLPQVNISNMPIYRDTLLNSRIVLFQDPLR